MDFCMESQLLAELSTKHGGRVHMRSAKESKHFDAYLEELKAAFPSSYTRTKLLHQAQQRRKRAIAYSKLKRNELGKLKLTRNERRKLPLPADQTCTNCGHVWKAASITISKCETVRSRCKRHHEPCASRM